MTAQEQWKRTYRLMQGAIAPGTKKMYRSTARTLYRREAALERKLDAVQRTIEAQVREIEVLRLTYASLIAQCVAEVESNQLNEQMSRDVLEDLAAMENYTKWAKEAENQERIEREAYE